MLLYEGLYSYQLCMVYSDGWSVGVNSLMSANCVRIILYTHVLPLLCVVCVLCVCAAFCVCVFAVCCVCYVLFVLCVVCVLCRVLYIRMCVCE